VGAAQDLAALDIDLAAITQAGGLEVDADAAAICGEDQCGEVGDGEGGGNVREGFGQQVRSEVQIKGSTRRSFALPGTGERSLEASQQQS
jgi:hypothetical protein